MLFPYQSDAPIYYSPWGTISLIACNILIYIAWTTGIITETNYENYFVLWYNDFHLIQLLTSAFAHADFLHLASNMLFLWCFGLIVEGKLGWKIFVPLYLGLALSVGIIEMIFMGGTNSGSLGASSVIYSLIVCSWLWAPLNRIDCLFVLFPIIRVWNAPVWGVSFFYIGIDLLMAIVGGLSMSTPLLHSIGAIVAIAPAILFLKYNIVDCEGWDLLTIKNMAHQSQEKNGAILLKNLKVKKKHEENRTNNGKLPTISL